MEFARISGNFCFPAALAYPSCIQRLPTQRMDEIANSSGIEPKDELKEKPAAGFIR
jgi:hypothetical protein